MVAKLVVVTIVVLLLVFLVGLSDPDAFMSPISPLPTDTPTPTPHLELLPGLWRGHDSNGTPTATPRPTPGATPGVIESTVSIDPLLTDEPEVRP